MMKNKSVKYFKIGLYVLAVFPIIFIFSSLSFFTYYGLILNFGNISEINPYEYPEINIFSNIIAYSFLISLLCVIIYIFLLIIIVYDKIFKQLKIPILINTVVFAISVVIVYTKILEFALD